MEQDPIGRYGPAILIGVCIVMVVCVAVLVGTPL